MYENHDIEKRDFNDLLDKQFLGVIVKIDDPRKEGRARVRVYSIHDDLEEEDIPWAYPKNKSVFFGKEGKAGSISIPKIGSLVAVRFNNGDPYSPEYFAIHELAQDIKDELNEEYDGSHIILFDGDQELKLWFTINKGLTFSIKDASINIKEDIVTVAVKETTITVEDQLITLTAPGMSSKVVVDCKNIELGAGATEAVIKGNAFQQLFNSHTHPTPAGPSSAPTLPMTSVHLSKTSKTK